MGLHKHCGHSKALSITVLYIPYLCDCKITPQVSCSVMIVKEFFHSVIPGPYLLNEITSF